MQIKYAEKCFANKNSQMHSGNNAKHILKMKKTTVCLKKIGGCTDLTVSCYIFLSSNLFLLLSHSFVKLFKCLVLLGFY